MEPAVERREHGSGNPGRLTCVNRSSCERAWITGLRAILSGLVKVQKRPLTCMRALPGLLSHRLGARTQTMTVLDEGSFLWSHRPACENVRGAETPVSALIGSPYRRLEDGEDAARGELVWPQAGPAGLRYQGLIGDERSGDVAGARS
jgi:hypothetical protein